MLKGKDEAAIFTIKLAPLSAAENSNFSLLQDTLRPAEKQISSEQADNKIDTIKSVLNQQPVAQSQPIKYNTQNISSGGLKQVQTTTDSSQIKVSQFGPININAAVDKTTSLKTENIVFPGKERIEARMEWLTIAIIISLFVFSWVKLAYNKFVVQIVSGLIDYQVAMRLHRERNVLFRNVSIGLHTVFYINIGLFIFYLLDFFKYSQIFEHGIFLSIAVYSMIVLVVYNIKSLFGKILGYIFLVQENFSQYIHNVNLYNKNIGLFLFPIIAIYPFVVDKIKPLIIYAGLFLLLSIFLLRSYRSAQIILKKGISLFYLILYLCAIEILPVLLLVKFTSAWIFKDN